MATTAKRVYHCAICRRELKAERWVFSTHTGHRYCYPGECRGERKGKGRR